MTKKKFNPDETVDSSTDSKSSSQADISLRQGSGGQAGQELRRAQEALEVSQTRYFDLYNLAPVGYFTLSEKGLILEVNLTAAKLLGIEKESLVKQPLTRLILKEDQEIYYLHRKKLFETGAAEVYELRMLRAAAAPFWARIEATAAKDADGSPVCLAMMSDITERKKAEQSLREAALQWQSTFDAVQDAVCLFDAEQRILRVNRAMAELAGSSPADLIGRRCREVTHGTTEPIPECRIGRMRATLHREQWDLQQGDHWFTVTVDPLLDENQTLKGAVQFIRDITNRKQAEEELRKKTEELQKRNDELARFTYTISHDLKSPLVTIQTFLGYLEQDARKPDAEGVDKDLRYIRAAADKMSRLLDELLEILRIGRKENPSEETPLRAIVQEALDLVAGRITERGAKVEVTKEPILVYGDRSRLVEIFQNLVDNAVKFMGDEPAPRVEIGVEQAEDEIVLFVRDNGIGIDPKHQPKLFGLFEKLDPGTEGSGIGLALVRRIVEVHGGRIWVESEGRGKGTTFFFTLAKTQRGLP